MGMRSRNAADCSDRDGLRASTLFARTGGGM